MGIHAHAALDREEGRILVLLQQMGEWVDQAVDQAMQSILNGAPDIAKSVVQGDARINETCREVEESVFAAILRHQPMASDLRELYTNAFVANELERVGDYAAGLAKMVLSEHEAMPDEVTDELVRMSEQTRSMIGRALEAYVASSGKEARRVAAEDQQVDDAEMVIKLKCRQQLQSGGEAALAYANAMVVAHTFERIGDRATNIAERAVFHADGSHEQLN